MGSWGGGVSHEGHGLGQVVGHGVFDDGNAHLENMALVLGRPFDRRLEVSQIIALVRMFEGRLHALQVLTPVRDFHRRLHESTTMAPAMLRLFRDRLQALKVVSLELRRTGEIHTGFSGARLQ